MRARTYWIPAATLADAGVIARALHRGAIPHMPWHDDEDACRRRADECNALLGARQVRPFAVLIEVRAVDDGRIVNVWAADRVGDLAATIVIFALIQIVGIASLWELLA